MEPGARGGTTVASVGDAGPVLDARARTSHRRRLDELRAALAEAERYNDAGQASAARTEIEFIEDQLAATIGFWVRDRRAASNAERARLTVTKRIKGVLERISSRHPTLGDHLTAIAGPARATRRRLPASSWAASRRSRTTPSTVTNRTR